MNKFIFFISFFCVLNVHTAYAKKPTVTVERVQSEIEYEVLKKGKKCGRIEKAAGCTSAHEWMSDVVADCKKKHILLTFGYQKYKIWITEEFGKKGSLEFNEILKHELTHVELYKRTIEDFYYPMAQALLMQYERSEKKGKSCDEIQNDISRLYMKYLGSLFSEIQKQNASIDGDENYAYRWRQMHNEKKQEPKSVSAGGEKRKKTKKKRKNKDEAERIAFDFIENVFTIVMDEFQMKEKIKNWFLNKQ